MSNDGIDYKKYDKGGTSPKAPKTTKTIVPLSHGRKKGGLTKALNRKKEQKALMEKMEKDY